jgi:large subunit ribosomal protein LP0
MPLSKEKKTAYFAKLDGYLNNYSRLFVVSADNVGSKQMADIRMSLRGKAEVLFGKNTMMRRAFKIFLAANPEHPFGNLLPFIVGNIGFVFTDSDLSEIRDLLIENVVPAPARVGAEAPVDVFVPPGPTGCDPGQTAFFQALSIATKISRGQIEIISQVKLISKGDRVEPGHAALLQKLGIHPFSYGMKIVTVYENGSLFSPEVLDLSEADIASKFCRAAAKVASVSLAIGYPTMASLRYSVASGFAKLLAFSLATEANTKHTQIYFDYLADPSKFAVAASAAAGGDDAGAAAEEEAPEEEEADVGAGGLFGDDDDDY